jgi:hypothetical protein
LIRVEPVRGHERGEGADVHNVFLLRFGPDGRCSEFTELYMRQD